MDDDNNVNPERSLPQFNLATVDIERCVACPRNEIRHDECHVATAFWLLLHKKEEEIRFIQEKIL